MKAIADIQQFVVGFLMFSQNESNTAASRPPRYDAYEQYLKGMEVWVKNELAPGNISMRYGSEVEKHFKAAIAIDQDFMPPYFKLMELFVIDRKGAQLDSLLKILDGKTSLFLEGDLLNYTIQKFMVSKDWTGLEKFLLSKTNMKLPGFRPYYQLAVNSVYRLNKPQAALDYLALCDTTDFDFVNKPADQLFYAVKTSALIKLRRHEEVVQLTSGLTFRIIASIRVNRWRSLYYLNRNETADKEVADFFIDGRPTQVFPHMALFRVSLIKNDTAAAALNYHLFSSHEKQLKAIANVLLFVRAVMMFRMNDHVAEAEKILSQDLPGVPRFRRIHQLGILYAVTGRPEKAKEVIEDMLAHEDLYDNGFTRYYIAKIELALGNKDKSMEYLQHSLKKGMEFGEDLFEYDSDLKDLFDYPPFIELVRPKG
jgi:tetratricopeptide (TPR) repeat protein